jgi:NADH-quinone oxidoreductase subunit C
MDKLFEELSTQFDLKDIQEQHAGQYFFKVKKDQAVSLISHLQQLKGFGHLVFLTAVDQIEQGKFHLVYMLHSYTDKLDLGVTVEIDRENEEMQSIHHLWPAAATYQRELREMFGINFPESPGVEDSFMLEGWEGIPPMRREFDSKEYSEKTFYPRPGRNPQDNREAMKEKLYPSEAETW